MGGEHIQNESFFLENPKYVSLDFFKNSKNGKIKEGDILLVKDGATIGKAMFVDSLPFEKMMLNEHVYKIEADKYFYYVIISHYTQHQFWMHNQSSAQESITSDTLKSFVFCFPPKSEQTAIAAFLDRKTAEIDQLIADKKQLLELYQEEKNAIINRAVTKGINPDAKMKESGIEWLGEIPEHWEVKKLKYVAQLKSGSNIVSEQIEDSGKYPVFGGNGLRGYFSEYTHNGNHVLIGRQGAYCGNIKYGVGKFWASEHAVVVSQLIEYEMLYLGELLKSMNLGQYSVSAAQPGLAVDTIKNLKIPFPPLSEQKAIVQFIETKCKTIDTKISRTEKLIELLTEYRSTIISEVVTGKVKVVED